MSQLTNPFSELKQKWKDNNVEGSSLKSPSLGLPPPPELSPLPSSTQYKHKHKVDSTDPSSSKSPFLVHSLSQAISSHQLTTPFPSELKWKQEDDNVEGSPLKSPDLSLAPSAQYKHKCEVNSTNSPLSKPFLACSLSWSYPLAQQLL